jgi:hypothetical protein
MKIKQKVRREGTKERPILCSYVRVEPVVTPTYWFILVMTASQETAFILFLCQ